MEYKTNPDIFSKFKFREIQLKDRCFPDDFVHEIVLTDCLNGFKYLPDESIDLIITSPPYFVNKSYERGWTFDYYESLLCSFFKESFRILKKGKYIVVNFGDYYNRGRFYESEVPSVYPASIKYFEWGRKANFDLQATRIWRKNINSMSIPFVCNSHPRPVFDYEHIWSFRKSDGIGKEHVHDRKLSQRAVLGENWPGSAYLSSHEASFPIELPMWALDVYSCKDDIVLDPFMGKGTTLMACEQKSRKSFGFEINPDTCCLANRYLCGTSVM